MCEYNKTIYKVFMKIKDHWKFIKTFNSIHEAKSYMEKYHSNKKFVIEMEESFD